MTRVLVTSAPAIGHINLVLPVARALSNMGVPTTVAASPDISWHVARWDFDVVSKTPLRYPTATTTAELRQAPIDMAVESASATKEIAEDLSATHLVFDRSDLGAAIAAESMRLKAICVASTGYGTYKWMRDDSRDIIEAASKPLRLSGMSRAIERPLWLAYVPTSFHGRAAAAELATDVMVCDPRARRYRREETPTGRVLLSYGTTPRVPRRTLLTELVKRLADSFEISVAAPPDDVKAMGTPRGVRFLELPSLECEVMEHSVVGCHGGLSTVTEALSAGVPVHSTPFSRDQHYVARACAALGAGGLTQVDEKALEKSFDEIAKGISAVAAGKSYHERADRFARDYARLPHLPEVLAEWL